MYIAPTPAQTSQCLKYIFDYYNRVPRRAMKMRCPRRMENCSEFIVIST